MKKDWRATALKWSAAAIGGLVLAATAYLYDWVAVALVFCGETAFTIYGLFGGLEEAQQIGGKADASSADVSVKP